MFTGWTGRGEERQWGGCSSSREGKCGLELGKECVMAGEGVEEEGTLVGLTLRRACGG